MWILNSKLIRAIFFVAILLMVLYYTYSGTNRIDLFKIYNVELKGVQSSDSSQLNNFARSLIGESLLGLNKSSLEDFYLNDHWITAVRLEKVYPNTVRIYVYEEVPLAKIRNSNGCFQLTQGGLMLPSGCSDVLVQLDESVNLVKLDEFFGIYNNIDFLQGAPVNVNTAGFEALIGNVLFRGSFDLEVFSSNFENFINNIEPKYKSIERVDLSVPNSVYVLGEL